MTLERNYIQAIEERQAKAARLIDRAKVEPNKQFALRWLEDAESELEAADVLRERANNYLH